MTAFGLLPPVLTSFELVSFDEVASTFSDIVKDRCLLEDRERDQKCSKKQTISEKSYCGCKCKGGRGQADGRAGEEGKVKGEAWDI